MEVRVTNGEPKPERMALMRRAWALNKVQKIPIRETAVELGLVIDGRPQFGKVQRLVRDYGERWRVVDELRQRLEVVEARVIQLETKQDDDLFGHDLGEPWQLDGDFIIVGDVHVSTTKWDFAQRPLQVAMKYLSHPRRLIIAGDMLNADSMSDYPMITPLPSFSTELKAARTFIDTYLTVFDEIWMFLGNHDRRVQKGTNNAIAPEDMLRLISHDERVKISHWGHCIVNTALGEYRVLHGSDYSINQLTVADQLAQKYQQHIISHHEHHAAVGFDKFKNHIVVNGGGLFDERSLAYVQLDDNKRPRMANGFVMLLRGYPYLFTNTATDWAFWLGNEAAERKTA